MGMAPKWLSPIVVFTKYVSKYLQWKNGPQSILISVATFICTSLLSSLLKPPN